MNTEHLPRALKEWAPFFETSGRAYALDPFLLAAICFRESGGGSVLSPPGPAGTGDGGHGRGLMQIDDRAFPAWCEETLPDGRAKWQDPGANIAKGAEVLKAAIVAFHGDFELAACAYNAGINRVKGAVLKLGYGAQQEHEHIAANALTTGHDYGDWVVKHLAAFRGGA